MAEACADCQEPAPASSLDTTVISKFGWRVSRRRTERGEDLVEVRCPKCWRAYRERVTSSRA
jgi:hypothetical protein